MAGYFKAGAAVNTIDLGKTPPKMHGTFGGHSPKLRSHVESRSLITSMERPSRGDMRGM